MNVNHVIVLKFVPIQLIFIVMAMVQQYQLCIIVQPILILLHHLVKVVHHQLNKMVNEKIFRKKTNSFFLLHFKMNVIYQQHKSFLMKQMIKSPLHQHKYFWWLLNGFVIYQHFQVYLFVIRYYFSLSLSKETSSNNVFYWHILILKYHVIWKHEHLLMNSIHLFLYSNNQMMKEGSRNK